MKWIYPDYMSEMFSQPPPLKWI